MPSIVKQGFVKVDMDALAREGEPEHTYVPYESEGVTELEWADMTMTSVCNTHSRDECMMFLRGLSLCLDLGDLSDETITALAAHDLVRRIPEDTPWPGTRLVFWGEAGFDEGVAL